jgi:hypothetical protein
MILVRLSFIAAKVLLVIGITSPADLAALDFDIETIEVSSKHNIDVIPFSIEASNVTKLLIIETPEINQLEKQIQGLGAEPIRTIKIFQRGDLKWRLMLEKALDDSMDLVDTIKSTHGIQLVGLQASQLVYLDEASSAFKPFFKTSSMFSGRSWGSSPLMDMFTDINGDGLDDFLMPNFDGWAVALQQGDGFQQPQLVGPRPNMSFSETARYVAYRAEEAFLIDENNDGRNDIAFWQDGYFEVHRQSNLGQFSKVPVNLDANLKDMLSGYAQITIGEGAKNDEGKNRLLDEIVDINNDGVSDLIVKRIKTEGIFGWESEYEVYLGAVDENNLLKFPERPSSIIRTDGFQFGNERLDITGDGTQEFLVTSVDISIGAVITALITRSVSVDVSIYKMINGKFPAKPSTRKTISARFDFGSGDLFIPAVLGADVTGDGQKDLLVQKDDTTLLVFPGQQGQTMFAKKAIKLSLALPASRTGFMVHDLDDDGRDELILTHDDNETAAISVVSFKN